MEKILLAMEAGRESTPAIDFACYLSKRTGSRLTGVFLEGLPELQPLLENRAPVYGHTNAQNADPALESIGRFKEACTSRGVSAKIHRDRGIPLDEIVKESRFSDLILLDPETCPGDPGKDFPGYFVQEVLLAAECPVVVAPYSFESLDEVIFAYDGTSSSVFAIKQFTYLFPEFREMKAVVVNVREEDASAIEEQFKMKEWLSAHYQEVEFKILHGKASDELFGYLLNKRNAIVVLGSYGRGTVSRFFKPSHAGLLLRTVNLPVFISHR